MGKLTVGSCRYVHKVYGPIKVTVRRGVSNITLSRRAGLLCVTMPHGVSVEEYERVLAELMPRLGEARRLPRFEPGSVLELPLYTFRFVTTASGADDDLRATIGPREATIEMGRGVDPDSDETSMRVSGLMTRVASRVILPLVVPPAEEIRLRLGIAPVKWEAMRGFTRLGKCYYDSRRIALSNALLFLPERRMVEFVICHELAHLTHPDHSPRFHRLCDAYLGGRERSLIDEIRHVTWPVVRQ